MVPVVDQVGVVVVMGCFVLDMCCVHRDYVVGWEGETKDGGGEEGKDRRKEVQYHWRIKKSFRSRPLVTPWALSLGLSAPPHVCWVFRAQIWVNAIMKKEWRCYTRHVYWGSGAGTWWHSSVRHEQRRDEKKEPVQSPHFLLACGVQLCKRRERGVPRGVCPMVDESLVLTLDGVQTCMWMVREVHTERKEVTVTNDPMFFFLSFHTPFTPIARQKRCM